MTQDDPIKVYDARWEVNDFSSEEIRRFIESVLLYGQQLGVETITISRDARSGSGSVMELALELSLKSGFTVFLCPDPISTPQSYFMTFWITKKHSRAMGLTITASHNPASYTGLKVTVPIVQAIGLDCGPLGGFTRVREIYHSPQVLPTGLSGKLNIVNLTEEYIRYSIKAAGITENGLKGMHVILDAMSGSAGPEIFTVLGRCGSEVEPLRLIPDGTFPTGSPNPTSKGKMDRAIDLSKAKDGALIVGTDGDGDRLVFGDGRGILSAGFASAPVLDSIINSLGKRKKVSVLYDPKVNPVALHEWFRLNIQPILFRNGHSHIKQYMRQIKGLAAVEESGHYYYKMVLDSLTMYCENSLLTILLFLKTLKERPGLLDELWDRQERVFTTGELNFRLADDEMRDKAMNKLVDWFKHDKAQRVTSTTDGIDLQGTIIRKGIKLNASSINISSDWYSGYLRIATNEKAVLRFYLSASSIDLGKKIELAIKEILHNINAVEIE